MRAGTSSLVLLASLAFLPLEAQSVPDVAYLFPAGGQRAELVEVTAGGKFADWPVNFWISDSSQVSVAPLDEQGKLEFQVSDTATPGCVWLRIYDRSGAAAPRPWLIGCVPETGEMEPNEQASSAQDLSQNGDLPHSITVNGRLQKAGDVDVFSLEVPGGRTLVADLDAQALASPVDGVLQILRPDGFVAAHNDDQHKLDPRLTLDLPFGGRWMVRVFGFPETPSNNVQLAGNEDYVYRLTISTGPCVSYALPMAASRNRRGRNQPCRWQFFGWNLPNDLAEFSCTLPDDADEVYLADERLGRSLHLPVVDFPVQVEVEPNAETQPTRVEWPISITGRISAAGDRDTFQFEAAKGDRLSIHIESRELGYPLDPVLELVDASDKRLARADDEAGGRDARIDHRVDADGPLRVIVSDLYGSGGMDYIYRLAIERAVPSFKLKLESHQVILKAGETADITVTVVRLHGFDQSIDIIAEQLPDGVSAASVTSKAGEDSGTTVVFTLAAIKDAAATSIPIRIVGQAESASAEIARFAVPAHPIGLAELWLTVIQ